VLLQNFANSQASRLNTNVHEVYLTQFSGQGHRKDNDRICGRKPDVNSIAELFISTQKRTAFFVIILPGAGISHLMELSIRLVLWQQELMILGYPAIPRSFKGKVCGWQIYNIGSLASTIRRLGTIQSNNPCPLWRTEVLLFTFYL